MHEIIASPNHARAIEYAIIESPIHFTLPADDDYFDEDPVSKLDNAVVEDINIATSSPFAACFNFINTIVGAGIIGIPLAIEQCGLYMG